MSYRTVLRDMVIASVGNEIVALDSINGTTAWRYAAAHPIERLFRMDQRVLVITQAEAIALDASSGIVAGKTPLQGAPDGAHLHGDRVVLVFNSREHEKPPWIVCLDQNAGLLWRVSSGLKHSGIAVLC